MEPSRFNVVTRFPATNELLVLNTANGALVAIDADRADVVERALAGDAVSESDVACLEPLRSQGFFVPNGTDEVDPVLRRIQLGIADANRLDVFVLPNMNCNFACPYCFEAHRPSQMAPEVEAQLLDWFRAMVPRFKVLLLSWFGGEPMLSYPQLLRIQREVRAICEAAGTTFSSHITTNGYQLTTERAAALCDAGLLSYQITMDGPPDVHNQSRVLKGPGNSFDRIFENLCSLASTQPDANIKLRVNFDTESLPRIPELLEMFPTEVRPRLHLVLERIFGQGMLAGHDTAKVAAASEWLYERARRLGFEVTATPVGPERLTYCYADRENQFLFTHTGDVFKCTVSDFDSKDRLGFLTEGGRIQWEGTGYDEWMATPAIDDECRECRFMPMCLGGCRKNRSLEGRASADCTLPFEGLELRLQQRYAVMTGLELAVPDDDSPSSGSSVLPSKGRVLLPVI